MSRAFGLILKVYTLLLFRLLTEKPDELVSLSILDVSVSFVNLISLKNKLEFPRLRELVIWVEFKWFNAVVDSDVKGNHKSFLATILEGAPKLEKNSPRWQQKSPGIVTGEQVQASELISL